MDDNESVNSAASCMSEMSISAFGGEMRLEKAVDQVFLGLQQSLNFSHSEIRAMAMDLDRDGDFKVSYEHHEQICDYVNELGELLFELKNVSLQVLGKPPADEKEWFKTQVQNRKDALAAKKAAAKIEKQEAKNKLKAQV